VVAGTSGTPGSDRPELVISFSRLLSYSSSWIMGVDVKVPALNISST
jgi:hypothetical protein